MFWKKKIKALLFNLPYGALVSKKNFDQVSNLIKIILGEEENTDITIQDIKEISEIASGTDIPKFVSKFENTFFIQNPCITDSLSGKPLVLANLLDKLNNINQEEIETNLIKTLEKAVKEIRTQVESVSSEEILSKRLFLALWRHLPETIKRVEKGSTLTLGHYWDFLPADPRIPSHSVWNQMEITSAIAGAMPEPATLIFTIGSAQEFVSTARKTQDFWMGSFILSYLTWEAIKVIAEECGPDAIIFPSLKEQPLVDLWLYEKGINAKPNMDRGLFLAEFQNKLQIANFPNMFTAIVPKQEAEALAKKAEKNLRAKWEKIAWSVEFYLQRSVSNRLSKQIAENTSYWNQIRERQTRDLIDRLGIFWVVCPWGNDVEQIKKAYNSIKEKPSNKHNEKDIIELIQEQGDIPNIGAAYPIISALASSALKARKTLRNFNQMQEPNWKCSLCGLREALHPKKTLSERELKEFWQALSHSSNKQNNFRLKNRIRKGEQLCTICLVKRLALETYFSVNYLANNYQQVIIEDEGVFSETRFFPSTSSIAVSSFKLEIINRLKEETFDINIFKKYVSKTELFLKNCKIYHTSAFLPKLEKTINNYKGELREFVKRFLLIDGDWLFEDSFDIQKLENEYQLTKDTINHQLHQEAILALQQLLEESKKAKSKDQKVIFPSRYYAVIAMDGDKIGNWLSGNTAPALSKMLHPDFLTTIKDKIKNTNKVTRPLGPAIHMDFSAMLKKFALISVPDIIEENTSGKIIYAGGDDVVALVPINNLLTIITQLSEAFSNAKFANISKEEFKLLFKEFEPNKKTKEEFLYPTASLGVAIVPESYPLTQAIDMALHGAMKEYAKDKLGRNAFSVFLSKNNRTPIKFGMKWSEGNKFDEKIMIPTLLNNIVSYMKEGNLSTKLPYDINAKSKVLTVVEKTICKKPLWKEAQLTEVARLAKRHIKETVSKEQKKKIIEDIQQLLKLLQAYDTHTTSSQTQADEEPQHSCNRLVNALLITKFIAGEI